MIFVGRCSYFSTLFVVVLGLATGTIPANAQDEPLDGEIILNDTSPTDNVIPPEPSTFGTYGEGDAFISSAPDLSAKTNSYSRVLAKWRDPLTIPHTRSACVKWASGNWPWGGGWKTCAGWKTQFQWLDNVMMLNVSTPDFSLKDIQQASNTCLATGAVAAALSAYVTGSGTVAVTTFKETLIACLSAQFTGAAITVDLPITSRWSSWQ